MATSPDRVLRRILDPGHDPPVARRSFGFLRPWNEVPALMGSAPPAMPPRPTPAWSPSSWVASQQAVA